MEIEVKKGDSRNTYTMRKLAVCGESGKQYPVFLGWDLLERDDWLEEIKFPSSFRVIVTNSRVGISLL